MNLSYRLQPKRRMSLKPYIYPRFYDIPESLEKAFIQKTRFFNSRLHTSQRQTQILSCAETFRDIDEFDPDISKLNKSGKQQQAVSENICQENVDEEDKTIESLFSRINRFYSLNRSKAKPNNQNQLDIQTTRGNQDYDQLSQGRRSSHQSQNSYKRLKQLFQLVPQTYPIQALDLNESYHKQETLKSSQNKKRLISESVDIHNCSFIQNTEQVRATPEEYKSKSVQTNNISHLHCVNKKQNSVIVQRNGKTITSGLFIKLSQLKQAKIKRSSLVPCINYQYF